MFQNFNSLFRRHDFYYLLFFWNLFYNIRKSCIRYSCMLSVYYIICVKCLIRQRLNGNVKTSRNFKFVSLTHSNANCLSVATKLFRVTLIRRRAFSQNLIISIMVTPKWCHLKLDIYTEIVCKTRLSKTNSLRETAMPDERC